MAWNSRQIQNYKNTIQNQLNNQNALAQQGYDASSNHANTAYNNLSGSISYGHQDNMSLADKIANGQISLAGDQYSDSVNQANDLYAKILAQYNTANQNNRTNSQDYFKTMQDMITGDYNSLRSNTEQSYAGLGDYLAQYRDAANASAQQNYEYGENKLKQETADAMRQAYVQSQSSLRDLPQQLAALGVNGGAAESTLAGMRNTYGNNRAGLARQQQSGVADLLQAMNNTKGQNELTYLQNMHGLDKEKVNALLSLENDYNNKKQGTQQQLGNRLMQLDDTHAANTLNLSVSQADRLMQLLQNYQTNRSNIQQNHDNRYAEITGNSNAAQQNALYNRDAQLGDIIAQLYGQRLSNQQQADANLLQLLFR